MIKTLLFTAFLIGTSNQLYAEDVEITGTIDVQIACGDVLHEESTFIVEPGIDKFSGTYHLILLTEDQKKQAFSGKKIQVKGRKIAPVKKMMTKGEVRAAMYKHMKKGEGLPMNVKNLDEIVKKIQAIDAEPDKKINKTSGKHNHGELELKPISDDNDKVEVNIPAHIAVDSISVVQ